MSKDRAGYVYLLHSQTTGWAKIGHSKRPVERVAQINAEVPGLDWTLDCSMWAQDRYQLERIWHDALGEARITQGKEWFQLTVAQINLFKTMCKMLADVEDSNEIPGLDPIRDPHELLEIARERFEVGIGLNGVEQPWQDILQDLRKNRQAMTSAVFESASVESFDAECLQLSYSSDEAFYVGMSQDPKHLNHLKAACYRKLGVSPQIFISLAEKPGQAVGGQA